MKAAAMPRGHVMFCFARGGGGGKETGEGGHREGGGGDGGGVGGEMGAVPGQEMDSEGWGKIRCCQSFQKFTER